MAKKTCVKCRRSKDLRQFTKDKRRPGKRLGRCKACRRKQSAEWKRKNPEKCRRSPEEVRVYRLRTAYRLTPETFEFLWQLQRGLCALCRGPMERGGRRPASVTIDHDHACCAGERTCGGCIRGLIHHRCNRLLGVAGDDVAILNRAVTYLTAWQHFRTSPGGE